MNPPPRLRHAPATPPTTTLMRLRDVLSAHCGILTDVLAFDVRDRSLAGITGYEVHLEGLTLLGSDFLRSRRGTAPEAWRHVAEGRMGHRFAFDPTRAFVRAVGEALERYACGLHDPAQLSTSTYEDLADHALDPRTAQQPTPDEYTALPGFAPFRPDAPMRWVQGWSVRDRRPILVPAQLCFLSYNAIPGEPVMQPGTSTGWALHLTLAEAAQAGLREVVERDAFFIHWLNRLPPPRLDLDSVDDPVLVRFRRALEARGLDLAVLVTTTDVGIPSFAAIVRGRASGEPAFLVTLGAHADPRQGLVQCVEEAAMLHLAARARVAAGEVAPPARMEDVVTMSDHSDFYLVPENVHHAAWLLDGDEVPWSRVAPLEVAGTTPLAEVEAMTTAWAGAGHDTVLVDTTPADLREAGFVAAKVLVPGAVRHEYGHGARFLDCPRITQAPVRMGRLERPRTLAELNPDVHPYA